MMPTLFSDLQTSHTYLLYGITGRICFFQAAHSKATVLYIARRIKEMQDFPFALSQIIHQNGTDDKYLQLTENVHNLLLVRVITRFISPSFL